MNVQKSDKDSQVKPDKATIEVALASLKQLSAAIACPDLPRRTRADESRWAAKITDALSVLTEALAERERDAARLDWLDSQSADGVHLEVCHKGSWAEGDLAKTATVFIGRKEFTARNSRIAIDAAMKETP